VSPRVYQEGDLIFWFHSYDVLHEDRASIHVGKGSQNDSTDAKIWLEPWGEVARAGRSLNRNDLKQAQSSIAQNLNRLLEAWYAHRQRTDKKL